jgi:hypothetical protein
VYFRADDNGDPDLSRPLTRRELVEMYWANVDDDPDMRADLYLDFHDFDRIEFLLFKERLSAAILVARSARNAISELKERFERYRHVAPTVSRGGKRNPTMRSTSRWASWKTRRRSRSVPRY